MTKKRFKYSEFCHKCRKAMTADDQIVYVEEGANRFFCSERCIRDYYDPMADYYKAIHIGTRDPHDIPEADFTKYESYAPLCLTNPDEVWLEENENGENYYYFLANFTDQGGRFSYVVMCFCLELEPTYLLLSFPTRDKKMVEAFRRGKQLELTEEEEEAKVSETEITDALKESFLAKQGNAIEEEMFRYRADTDIPRTEFDEHSHLLEETIENPDEVWELQDEKNNTILTLINQQDEQLHYVVICTLDVSGTEGAQGQESWRVIYSFPTNDQALVQRYCRGALREGAAGTASFLH